MANSFVSRFLGLQFRSKLEPGHGMLLRPCSSLHTCFMRFPIDVVMLDRQGMVLGVRRHMRPWRVLLCVSGTYQVIETAVGATDVESGQVLEFLPDPDAT
jgi:uncharacterized protein